MRAAAEVRNLAAALALCQGLALPASATETVDCSSPEVGEASLSLVFGSLPVLHVLRAEVTVGGTTWSTDEGAANRLAVGQAFRDGDRLLVDLTDPNVEEVIAAIRLEAAVEEDAMALAGILRMKGRGAWPLTCVGP